MITCGAWWDPSHRQRCPEWRKRKWAQKRYQSAGRCLSATQNTLNKYMIVSNQINSTCFTSMYTSMCVRTGSLDLEKLVHIRWEDDHEHAHEQLHGHNPALSAAQPSQKHCVDKRRPQKLEREGPESKAERALIGIANFARAQYEWQTACETQWDSFFLLFQFFNVIYRCLSEIYAVCCLSLHQPCKK